MASNQWSWASLSGEQLALLKEGESTLGTGVDLLLAYQEGGVGKIREGAFRRSKLEIGKIDASQMECLQGIEKKIGAVVVAYRQAK